MEPIKQTMNYAKAAKSNLSVKHCLRCPWVLWHHDINDPNYKIEAYFKIIEIETIEDFWITFNQITDFSNGMFFLMRKGISPLWEDPINAHGGAWKFKVKRSEATNIWVNLAMTVIGETISDHPEKITGISISPKYQNATIRVWNNDKNRYGHHFSNDIDPHIIFKNSIYELNSQQNL